MTDFIQNIVSTISCGSFCQKAFPMLTDWGIKDEDLLMHSLGVSLWTQLGVEFGYMGISELPAPNDQATTEDVRSDSVWFDKTTHGPAVFVEYERFNGSESHKQKLCSKVRNLLLAKIRWQAPDAYLILAYWTIGLASLPDHMRLKSIVSQGYYAPNGQKITGCVSPELLILHFIFKPNRSGHLVLDEIIPRGIL